MISQKITSWVMEYGKHSLAANAPCSLYSVLLEHKIIEDPFYRLNEKGATALSEKDMELSAKIYITAEMLKKRVILMPLIGVQQRLVAEGCIPGNCHQNDVKCHGQQIGQQ